MVLDTSVVVAVLQEEPGFETFLEKLGSAVTRSISAASYVEASMVLLGRRGEKAEKELDRFLADGVIAIVPVSVTQAKIAEEHFGGSGRAGTPPDSTAEIALRTHWLCRKAIRCCSRVGLWIDGCSLCLSIALRSRSNRNNRVKSCSWENRMGTLKRTSKINWLASAFAVFLASRPATLCASVIEEA